MLFSKSREWNGNAVKSLEFISGVFIICPSVNGRTVLPIGKGDGTNREHHIGLSSPWPLNRMQTPCSLLPSWQSWLSPAAQASAKQGHSHEKQHGTSAMPPEAATPAVAFRRIAQTNGRGICHPPAFGSIQPERLYILLAPIDTHWTQGLSLPSVAGCIGSGGLLNCHHGQDAPVNCSTNPAALRPDMRHSGAMAGWDKRVWTRCGGAGGQRQAAQEEKDGDVRWVVAGTHRSLLLFRMAGYLP